MRFASGWVRLTVHVERVDALQGAVATVYAERAEGDISWLDSFEVGPFDTISDVVAQCVRASARHGVCVV